MFGVSPRLSWQGLRDLAFGASLSAPVALMSALILAGCGSSPTNRAPVEDRGTGARAPQSAPAPVAVGPTGAATPTPGEAAPASAKPLPGAENAGKPGYYTVKPGDTLIRIGLDNGQNWRDVVRWNAIENPNQIEVGQVLRVIPPVPGAAGAQAAATPGGAAQAPAGAASGVVTRPVASQGASGTALPPAAAGSPAARPAGAASAVAPASGTVVAAAPASAPPAAASTPAASADDDITWVWPTSGAVLAGFDEVKNKGLDIGGTAGSAVMAAADGRVVYVGAGLRGYGNLIILKHNNTYLTAYAHNQTLLVKEDQSVRKGQKIAEMGSSDADREKLHFEVLRQGKPVDPAKYLPPR